MLLGICQHKYGMEITVRKKAQITIEMSIVFPMIMMVICMLIFIVFYMHDVVCIDSYAYANMVERWSEEDVDKKDDINKISGIQLFLLTPNITVSEGINNYTVQINASCSSQIKWMSKLLKALAYRKKITVTKKISIKNMYLYKGIKDGLKN